MSTRDDLGPLHAAHRILNYVPKPSAKPAYTQVFGDAADKRFAVENRSEFATDVVEKREGFCFVGVREKWRRSRRVGGEAGRGR